MNITKQKGLITELECELAFSKLGILLSKPIAEDSRYDYIADLGNKMLRIQCKTSSIAEDKSYIEFATRSSRSNTKENLSRNYTKDEIDYFYTCYNNISYLVPVEECSTSKVLRFIPPKNNQNTKASFAKDFELKEILKNKENFNNFQELEINIISKTKQQKIKTCEICGKIICNNSIRCVQCNSLNYYVTEHPSREQLKFLIRTLPFTKIGEKYNVTDNAVRKWCDSYNLPRRKKEITLYNDEEWRII